MKDIEELKRARIAGHQCCAYYERRDMENYLNHHNRGFDNAETLKYLKLCEAFDWLVKAKLDRKIQEINDATDVKVVARNTWSS